ncbi:MAG: FkbM family methyltransferase, partial [Candidatus Zixiibacteriota bacterium]
MINKIRKILKNIPAVVSLVRKVKKLSLPMHVKVGNSRVFIGNDLGMRKSYTSPGYFSSFEKIIDKYIKEGDVVIDIGAHVGITTLMMSEKVGIHGEVLSFEPSPNSFFILNQNISNNEIKNVSLFQSAIADKKGVLNFYTNKFHTGFNSLSKSNAEINIGIDNDLQAIEVSTDTLDNIIYSNHKIPKFIKMDVQGAE